MKWVTREKAKVDRIACPWLIKNFIDQQADFIFVPEDQVLEVTKKEQGISFDTRNAQFTHAEDGRCTFEVLVAQYQITDPAILKLAKVVHGADVPKDVMVTPESAGLQTIAEGFRIISIDDHDNLAKQFAVYDALYAYFKESDE